MEYGFVFETPLGKVVITENGAAINGLYFAKTLNAGICHQATPLINKAGREVLEYLNGKRRDFDLPLAPSGTDFQLKVWKALQEIPYGEVRSYQEIAQAIGNEKACRAVGGANNKNPISIIIPCHRVIGAKGDLVGYAVGWK